MRYGIFYTLAMVFLTAAAPLPTVQTGKTKSATVWVTENNKGKSLTYKDIYLEYDRKGNLVAEINYRKDGSVNKKEVSRYDNFGNRIEKVLYDEVKSRDAEIIRERKTYAYNAHREKTEECEYDTEGQLKSKTVFTYNADGKKLLEKVYDKNGKLKKQVVYTYNRQKQPDRRMTISASGDTTMVKRYAYEYF